MGQIDMNPPDLINVRGVFLRSIRAHIRTPDHATEKLIVKELFSDLKDARADGYSFVQISRHLEKQYNLPIKTELLSLFYQDINREYLAQLALTCEKRLDEELAVLNAIKYPESPGQATQAVHQSAISPEVDSAPQEYDPLATNLLQVATRPEGKPRFRCRPLQEGFNPLRRKPTVPNWVYEEGILEHPAVPGLHLNLEERVFGSYLEIVNIETGEVRFEELKEKSLRVLWIKKGNKTTGSTSADFTKMNLSIFSPDHI